MSIPDLVQRKRMVVILPEDLAGSIAVANRIHQMASLEQFEVLYLTLVDDYDKMLSRSRSMTTMDAVTGGNRLMVFSRLVKTSEWLNTLMDTLQPDDIIVCQAEQLVSTGPVEREPLGQYLHKSLPNRVIIMSGFYRPVVEQIKRLTLQGVFLLGFLVIFALFTALEIYLDRSLAGAIHTFILCAVIVCEFGIVYAWNRLLSR